MTNSLQKKLYENGYLIVKNVLNFNRDLKPILNDMEFVMDCLIQKYAKKREIKKILNLDFKKIEIPADLINKSKEISYDHIFILKPWEDIYVNDSERYETFRECINIHKSLLKTYKNFDLDLINIPNSSIEERIKFVKRFVNVKKYIKAGIRKFASEVRSKKYPTKKYSY